jgi:hypothetical protein
MNDKQRRRYERLENSRDIATKHVANFPPNSVGGKALANISTRIDEVDTLDAARSTHQRTSEQGTGNRREARAALNEQIGVISDTSETIALDYPEFKNKFRRLRTNINDQNLLTTARSFYNEALPHKARFIEYGMKDTFLDTFNNTINKFEQSINQQNQGKGGSSANNAAINAALDAAEADLDRLDTAFSNHFADDPAALAEWEIAHHLQSGPKKPKTQTPPPPPAK